MLGKMSQLTEILQSEGSSIEFAEVAKRLRDLIENSSVHIVSKKGKLLGAAIVNDYDSTSFDAEWIEDGYLPPTLSTALLKVAERTFGDDARRIVGDYTAAILPVIGSGRRVGTLIVIKEVGDFTEEDLILAEYASTTVGLVIAYALDEEEEDEAEEKRMARSAIKSLSYSEIRAMQSIFDELEGDEGLLVASRVADEAGITRSVIVNALRKLASANVIESRSLGMKGTYLRILNTEIRKELNRQRYPRLSSATLVNR